MDLSSFLMNAVSDDGDSSPQYFAVVCTDDDVSSPLNHVYLTSPHSSSSSDPDCTMSPPQQVPQLEHWSVDVIHKYTLGSQKMPQLEIVEEPVEMFRFRYKSEMGGTHGSLIGKNSHTDKNRTKTYPTVKLKNYSGSARIMCTLVQNEDGDVPKVHPHRLITRYHDEVKEEPHAVEVGPDKGYIAKFPGMAIVHTAKKKVHMELYKKRKELLQSHRKMLSHEDDMTLKLQCENEARNINMNSVRLCFSAYDSNYQQLCNPITTKAIDNLKSAETGALKITRMSKTHGTVQGGEEVYMFVEKVSKKNIKVRFFEMDAGERTWNAFASFSETDVHHQFGIVFMTPEYRDKDIRTKVIVYVELYRPKDGAVSEPKTFEYKPAAINHKRRRAAENSLSSLINNSSGSWSGGSDAPMLSGNDVPLTVAALRDISESKHCKFEEEALYNRMGGNEKFLTKEMDLGPAVVNDSLDAIRRDDLLINSPFHSSELQPYKLGLYGHNDDDLPQIMENTHNLMLDGCKSSGAKNKVPHVVKLKVDNQSAIPPKITKEVKLPTKGISILLPQKHKVVDPSKEQVMKMEVIGLAEKPDVQEDKDELYPKSDTDKAKKAIKVMQVYVKSKPTPAIAEKLLELFDVKLLDGDSFLHMFVAMNYETMVTTLLDLIKSLEMHDILNYVNDRGETALHTAIIFFRHEIMGLLLNAGCDPNLHDDDGNTPLHLAVKEDNSECMVQLLDRNNYSSKHAKQLDVNIFNNAGWTALHLAATCGSLASVSRLINAGADCNIRARSNGRTVLHLAIAHPHIVNYILEHSEIDVNAEAENGDTALHMSCSLDNPRAHEICESLLQHGANPKMKFNGMTALDFAKSNINVQVLNVLKSHLSATSSNDDSIIEKLDENTSMSVDNIEVKEEPEDFEEGSFLDSKTIEIVTTLLNESGTWKIMAVELGHSSLISLCQESDNPSRMLLHYVELEDKLTLKDLYNLLLKLGEEEAAEAVKNLIRD